MSEESFADLARSLSAPAITAPTRTRVTHPKGWEPGVKFDPETSIPTEITTPPVDRIAVGDWRSVLTTMQIDLPAGYELRLAEAKYDPAAWHRDVPFVDDERKPGQRTKAPAVTRPVWRYRFLVVATSTAPKVDAVDILNRLHRTPKPRQQFAGDSAFVVNLNDWQLFKDDVGETVERLDRYFDLALERAKDLGRRNLGELVVLGGGDIVEGCTIYPNQAFQIRGDRRDQMNHATTLIESFLDRMAPAFPRVRVLAVGGNHGEHRVDGKRINRHDNDDCKVFEDTARAFARDPKMSHVSFMVAQDQPALTVDILGHITALTHGHVYGKAKGGEPSLKAYEWYKNMAAAHHPVGDAVVLVGNHFHHDIVKNWGTLLFVQTPAADGGSPEFADYSGTDCPPGMSTWVVSTESRFRDYEVLR